MITPVEARSGKGHRDENFPVASRLIHPRHRAPILAFYEFVRTADDIADHAALAPAEKLALIDRLEATLLGKDDQDVQRSAGDIVESKNTDSIGNGGRNGHALFHQTDLDHVFHKTLPVSLKNLAHDRRAGFCRMNPHIDIESRRLKDDLPAGM